MANHQAVNGTESTISAALPWIDLSNPDIHQSAVVIKRACMDSGMFYVINHGISEEFINEVYAQSKNFFALPLEEKMKFMVERNRGYLKTQFLDQETNQQARGEAFAMVDELPDADKDAEKPLRGQNVWPPADTFPGWKEAILKYQQAVLNVGRAVARIIAVALQLNVDFFDQPEYLGNALTYLSLNHYGVEGADHSKKPLLGAPPHSDPNFITLLTTDEVPGLQICRNIHAKPRVWENVSPLKGAFIVNVGNMLERMSNCVFRSVMHRVLFSQDRYTITFFVYPSHDATIECIPSCTSAENPPKYPAIKSEELLDIIFPNVAAGRTEIDITKALL